MHDLRRIEGNAAEVRKLTGVGDASWKTQTITQWTYAIFTFSLQQQRVRAIYIPLDQNAARSCIIMHETEFQTDVGGRS